MNTCAVVPSLVVPKGLLTKHPLPAIELAVAPSRSMGINILRIGKNLKCPVQGNGRVYVISEAAALRQFLCFLPVLHAHPPGRGDTVDTIRVSFSLSLPVPLLPGQACAPAGLADRDSTAVAKLR